MTAPTRTRPVGPGAQRRPDRLRQAGDRVRAAARAPWAGRVGVGVAILVAATALLISAERSDTRAQRADAVTATVTAQRDGVAEDLREDATTISALCATGGEVARALDAAGQCGRAAARLADPIVAAQQPTLTAEQINAIVARVLALTPPPVSVDAVVPAVLARIGTDPTLRGLNEAEIRAIVAAAVAALPVARDGEDGIDGQDGQDGGPGPPGTSFGGLDFDCRGGHLVALVTFIEPDGSTRRQTVPVDGATCGRDDPRPTTAPPITEPPTTAPPAPPATDPPAPPTTAPGGESDAPPSTPANDSGGVVPGLIN